MKSALAVLLNQAEPFGADSMEGRPSPARDATRHPAPLPTATGAFVEMDGETYFRIADCDRLPPFLMAIPGDADLWMFIASRGGLTAGRIDADNSLFPYRTVDELHDAHRHSGPLTLLQIGSKVWEPFADQADGDLRPQRNLYKNVAGNRLLFEEIRADLGLRFRYAWSSCDRFGWVRSASLANLGDEDLEFDLLDGLRNVLPYGAPLGLQQQASNLVDAYKRSELDELSPLAIFALSSRITDRPEAAEVLRANVVWSYGLPAATVHLDAAAITAFRERRQLPRKAVLEGARGNYLVAAQLRLASGTSLRWKMVADCGLDQVAISALRAQLRSGAVDAREIDAELREAGERLRENVASADGLQLSARTEYWVHHFANVLFNNMRGGVFARNGAIPARDFADFVRSRNESVADRHGGFLAELADTATVSQLIDQARATGDPDLERLCFEYLPLGFGRRHGDPSRPWNRFSIRVRDRQGRPALSYEGNWRDIFQNWEALCTAFPEFLPSVVAKFVNASTADGFNPYRITREGVDWEIPNPEEPWSHIGYWGDHQIIYLLKLLEAIERHRPELLRDLLEREVFSYAEVPYRLRPYPELCEEPRKSIVFDHQLHREIEERVEKLGGDGRLLRAATGAVYHANLLEKLLVPALSKLSNLIPDAGIWMNTQRPEWNDANNALAGTGISVVTMCYLRRYLDFAARLLENVESDEVMISSGILDWFGELDGILREEQRLCVADALDSWDRKRLMDRLGTAFSTYRESLYANGLSGKRAASVAKIREFFLLALRYVEWGIDRNRREDGLFHSYNLLNLEADARSAKIARLPEMLEGQVAVISSGHLSLSKTVQLLERLYASSLYREDQRSFLLYPVRELPDFLERNVVPEEGVQAVPLLVEMLQEGRNDLIAQDVEGLHRFHGDLRHADDLAALLDQIGAEPQWSEAVARDRTAVLDLFESVFEHRSYTGRSGVMYAFEGLGCIYWHMVAKLLLATQEQAIRAQCEQAPAATRDALVRMYYRIRSGIGFERSVAEYGAFPTDPYSHTPADGGAEQPGMTGQVKEEILTRAGELGILVEDGCLRFEPFLLREDEFLGRSELFRYFSCGGRANSIALEPASLAFTVCQVPVVMRLVEDEPWIETVCSDGEVARRNGLQLDAATSRSIFARDGSFERIEVGIPRSRLDHSGDSEIP